MGSWTDKSSSMFMQFLSTHTHTLCDVWGYLVIMLAFCFSFWVSQE